MQDRFKFRFWNKTCKCFFVGNKNEKENQSGSLHIFEDVINDNDFVVLQCTGLKDKNGKLVYFGDIVKNNEGELFVVIQNLTTGSFDYGRVVLYRKECLNSKYKFPYSPTEIAESEVIGNIYEHNYLLGETNEA